MSEIDATEANPWRDGAGGVPVFLLESRNDSDRTIMLDWLRERAAECGQHLDLERVLELGYDTEAGRSAAQQAILGHLEEENLWFVPLRVVWLPRKTRRQFSLLRLLLGDQHHPGRLRRYLIRLHDPSRCRVLMAPGASPAQLRERLLQTNPDAADDVGLLADFVLRRAILALERSERDVRGARYKIPALIEEEVLAKPRLVEALKAEGERSGRASEELIAEARECLAEMSAQHSPFALDVMAALGRYLYTRGFDPQVEFADGDVERIKALSKQHPIAFLMTHKSHIDGFLLYTLFYDLDMTPVHVFGGINMSFFGLGALGRKSGAIFIRRKMTGDNVYKAVFKQYIDYLAEKRFPLLWALEGTRSRTGKLMPPRFGLINYVVDSYVRQSTTDTILMPVAIAYDQIPEVRDYAAEQKGVKKRPESASWFMQYISGLHHPFGKIHVRFGKGVALSEVLGEPRPDLKVSSLDLQKIAFQLSIDANSVTPVLGTSMICFVLISAGGRALTLSELGRELNSLAKLVRLLNLPTTSDVNLATLELVVKTLQQLVATGVLVRYDEGDEPLFAVAADAMISAAYYRNAMLHFLVNGAIGEMAFLYLAQQDVSDRREAFRAEALRIRDVLKFEFFFAEKQAFVEELEAELAIRLPGWEQVFDEDQPAIVRRLWEVKPLLAHGALWPFIDAYRIVAESLLMLGGRPIEDRKAFLRDCASLGRQRVLQKRVTHEESVSTSLLENGILVADSRHLLSGDSKLVEAQRRAFLEEMTGMVTRLRFIASMADGRRLGLNLETASPGYLANG